MLVSDKTTGSIYFFFASKEAYPIVRQLENITVKKAEAKVVKCAKNKSFVSRTPPWSLNAAVNGKLELTLLKGRQRFDTVSTSNLKV